MLLYSLFDRRLFNYCIIHYGKKGNIHKFDYYCLILIYWFQNSNIIIVIDCLGGNGSLFRGSIASIWKRQFVSGWSSCPERRFVHSSGHGRCPRRRSNHHRRLVRWRMVWNTFIFLLSLLFILHNQITNSAKYIFQMLILYILLLLLRLYRFPFSLKNIKREKQYRRSHPNINRIKSSLLMLYVSVGIHLIRSCWTLPLI